MRTASYDIVVAGLGGQGVNTLTTILFDLSHAHGWPCQGAVFKGGAQKAGTIHSEIRIFTLPADDHAYRSNQILKGALDLMLGLEPHEAVRFADFFNPDTRLILNDAPVPFFSERSTGRRPPDPVTELRRTHRHVIARNFSDQARSEYGERRMTGLLMLREAAGTPGFPFDRDAVEQVLQARVRRHQPASHQRRGK
jgi:indolepyruvate ferredoxin oxidoreductase, beta subunit